ncbi:MAG: hypothetical protein ACLGPL_07125 [Acidobacteriota bacterium]
MLTQDTTSDLGLGAGVELNIDLGGLKSAVSALNGALAQTGVVVDDLAADAIRVVREMGLDKIVELAKEGTEEAAQLVGQLYMALNHAAKRGVAEAGELFAEMGRKLEEAGMTVKHTCSCQH